MESQLQQAGAGGYMSRLKLVLPAVIALGGFLLATSVTYGKPEYTKKEKKGCVVCHTKANSKELNDVGKCYEKKKSMEGCAADKK